jgi:hypothetical protein
LKSISDWAGTNSYRYVIETSIRYNALDKQKHVLNETSAKIVEAPTQQISQIMLASNSNHGIIPNMPILKHPVKIPLSPKVHKSYPENDSLPSQLIEEVSIIVPKIISEAPITAVPNTSHVRLATRDGIQVSDNILGKDTNFKKVSFSPDTYKSEAAERVMLEGKYKAELIAFIRNNPSMDIKLTEKDKTRLINELEKTRNIRIFFQESLANATDELRFQTILSERVILKTSIATFESLLAKLDKYIADKQSGKHIAQNDEQFKIAA